MNRHRPLRRSAIAAGLLLLLALPGSAGAFDWQDLGRDLLGGSSKPTGAAPGLSTADITAGLKEALRVGSERVVARLGTLNGFNADPQIHIPLPPSLERARTALTAIGMGGLCDDLELKLNRAAEEAVPETRALFVDAIEQMTLEDVQAIYHGPEDAATRYFQAKMSEPLAARMKPLVERSLAEVGAVQAYDAALGEYRSLPFVPDLKADLTGYVVDKGLDGVFFYLAREEAAIRANPAQRTTELLRKVFATP